MRKLVLAATSQHEREAMPVTAVLNCMSDKGVLVVHWFIPRALILYISPLVPYVTLRGRVQN